MKVTLLRTIDFGLFLCAFSRFVVRVAVYGFGFDYAGHVGLEVRRCLHRILIVPGLLIINPNVLNLDLHSPFLQTYFFVQ